MQSIQTPVGDLQIFIEATCGQTDAEALANCIRVAPYDPGMPSGMSVSGCAVALVEITPEEPLRNVKFGARLIPAEQVESGPETGEHLEAQGFRSDRHVLLVGTEDADLLDSRLMRSTKLPVDPYTYTHDSISIRILEAAAGSTLSLHFAVAWNDLPEPQDCSCWFAVDQNHEALVSAFRRHQLPAMGSGNQASTSSSKGRRGTNP